MTYKCPICEIEVKGKKKGHCWRCREKYPFENSGEGGVPFSRIAKHNKEVGNL